MIGGPAIEAAAAAHALVAAAADALQSERAGLRQVEQQLKAARTTRSSLRDAEDRDAAIRLVDGDAAAPPQPDRAARIAELTSQIPALTAAIPLINERIEACAASVADAQKPFVAASLQLINRIQDPAVDRMTSALAALAEPIAELLAADIVRNATVGESFLVPHGAKVPANGRIMAMKILDALPAQFRSNELHEDRLFARARRIAAGIMKQIKQSKKES